MGKVLLIRARPIILLLLQEFVIRVETVSDFRFRNDCFSFPSQSDEVEYQ